MLFRRYIEASFNLEQFPPGYAFFGAGQKT